MPSIPIRMPQLGESIAEAVVVGIHVKPGDTVEADQEILEVETNKAVMGVPTPYAGTIGKVIAELDQNYVVGALLANIEVNDEVAVRHGYEATGDSPSGGADEESDLESGAEDSPPAGPSPDQPHFAAPRQKPAPPQEETSRVNPTIRGLPVPANATGAAYLSPRMKARMHELGLHSADLAGVAGSGSGGRVTIEDLERYLADIEKHKMTAASPMRIAVADSMRRSWARPLATVGMPCCFDAVLVHRRAADPKAGPALYATRALAIALAEDTAVAGRLVGERIVHPKSIDIGFAVEVPDGVLVPVIREVDHKPLRDLVQEYNSLVEQARRRRLPNEAGGPGIATVTNYGTFGMVWATPIPLPEQNLVLGIGCATKQPAWNEEKQQFLPVMEAVLTLSFDHRILDGGAAGRLLTRIADLLQTPEKL